MNEKKPRPPKPEESWTKPAYKAPSRENYGTKQPPRDKPSNPQRPKK